MDKFAENCIFAATVLYLEQSKSTLKGKWCEDLKQLANNQSEPQMPLLDMVLISLL